MSTEGQEENGVLEWGMRNVSIPMCEDMGTFSFQLLAHGYRSCLSLQTNLPLMPLVPACCQTSLPSFTTGDPLLFSSTSEPLPKLLLSLVQWLLLSQQPRLSFCSIEAFALPSQVIIDVIAIGLFIHLGGALCKK